ncbi:MAG: type VII secretion integral membrane protein EccD [Streptomycetaceae bacterium]|nr:type VII secretion integral membrane protein EccD [Streptomycetaceae bacterium]
MVSSQVIRSARLSRITLVGLRRRVDMVLPSDEPIGILLPDVLRLLDDKVSSQPMLRHLVTADGTVLPQDGTLASAGIADGAVLRLVRAQTAPAAPVVHDVTDEVADDLDLRAWRWRPATRRWTAGAIALVLTVFASVFAQASLGPSAVAPWLVTAAVVALIAGVVAGLAGGNRGLATALLIIGGTVGVLGAWALGEAQQWPTAALGAGVTGAVAVTLVLLGVASPVGRGALVGAAALAGVGVVWLGVADLLGGAGGAGERARLGAVLAVVSVVVLGVLPRFALAAAGLTRLDDQRAGGVSVGRYAVTTAIAAAHRGLSVATAVVAVSAAGAGWLVVSVPTWWTVLVAVLTAVVVASRARAFPLVAEVVVLFAAAVVVLVRLVAVWIGEQAQAQPTAWPVVVLVAVALLPLGVLAVDPPEHVRVRLRRVTDLVEAVGVIMLFPLVLGVFGVYGQLLGTF